MNLQPARAVSRKRKVRRKTDRQMLVKLSAAGLGSQHSLFREEITWLGFFSPALSVFLGATLRFSFLTPRGIKTGSIPR